MCPIIACAGRTARPSTCQSRTSDSQACGSVKPPCSRTVSTNRDSCVVVATYAQTMPPGRSASAAASRHSHGASMSRMTRSARSPGRGQRLGEVAEGEPPGRVVAAEELRDVGPGDVGELLAPLVGRHPAVGADRAQQGAGQCAGPDAGLDDVRAGEDVGHRDDLGGVLGVDHRGTARHRDHELAQQRPEDEVLPAGRRRDREALVAADQVVVLEVATVGEEALARERARSCADAPSGRSAAPTRPRATAPGGPPPRPRAGRRARRRVRRAAGGPRTCGEAIGPRGCVRRARYAAASLPLRAGAERAVDVGGREHAEDAAVGVDQEVLRRRTGR